MTDTSQKTQEPKANLWAAFWDTLGDLKFAAVLLLIFTAASLIGTFVPQGELPHEYEAAYGQTTADILQSLQLTKLYYSGWYRLLIALITASVLVCTINRYKITLRRSRLDSEFTADRVKAMRASRVIELKGPTGDAAARISESLRRMGYRAQAKEHEGRTCIVGDKGRIGNWGMFILHASVLVVVLGALIGARLGFTDYTMWIAEGESSNECFRRDYSQMVYADDPHNPGQQVAQPRIVPKELPFSIFLEDFHVGVSEKGTATAYESQVRVVEDDKTVKRFKIATNRPLSFRGINFYQNDFSLAAVTVKVVDPEGNETLTSWPVQALSDRGGRAYRIVPIRSADVGGPDGLMFVIPAGLAPNYDPEVPWEMPTRGDLPANPAVLLFAHPAAGPEMGMRMPEEIGWVSRDHSLEFAGHTFSLAEAQLESALGVGRNPGLPIVYVGFGALVLGLILAFYVRHRIVRVCLWDEGGQARAAMGGTTRLASATFDREFETIEKASSA